MTATDRAAPGARGLPEDVFDRTVIGALAVFAANPDAVDNPYLDTIHERGSDAQWVTWTRIQRQAEEDLVAAGLGTWEQAVRVHDRVHGTRYEPNPYIDTEIARGEDDQWDWRIYRRTITTRDYLWVGVHKDRSALHVECRTDPEAIAPRLSADAHERYREDMAWNSTIAEAAS